MSRASLVLERAGRRVPLSVPAVTPGPCLAQASGTVRAYERGRSSLSFHSTTKSSKTTPDIVDV